MKKKKLWSASLSLLFALVLTSCNTDQAADNISSSLNDTIANALPNLYVTLAQLGAFIVMVIIFYRFCYKPIKARLKARQDHIENQIRESNEKNIEANRNLEDAKMNLKNSHKQADNIISEATKSAQVSAEEIISKANKDAENIRLQSEKDAVELKKEVERQAHDEIVQTALDASKEVLKRELTKEDNDKVIDDFINKMGDDKK